MADNYTTNSGSGGNTYASDDIGGVHWPRVKLAIGADGAATDVSSANPIPISDNSTTLSVDDGAGSLTVDNSTLSVVGGGTEATAMRVTLASDSTGVLSVDDNGSTLSIDDGAGSLTVDNAALSVTGGGVEATALRVTIASDSTGLVSVDDGGSTLSIDDGAGSLTVDNAALSVTGGGVEASALRVTLATDSTGVLSVDDNGSSLTVDNAALSVTGGGVEASALRVTLASDSTGVMSVDDNGGSLTVDGTVTASIAASTTGGASIYRTIDLDETEEEVKATAGTVYGMWVSNLATATRFIKFYNDTAANVTVGTTTPAITIAVPGNSTDDVSGNFGLAGQGIAFSTAICIAATTGIADADTGAPSANDVICNVFYK